MYFGNMHYILEAPSTSFTTTSTTTASPTSRTTSTPTNRTTATPTSRTTSHQRPLSPPAAKITRKVPVNNVVII